ncbi:MAG: MSCRAMM family protein, partial [Sarcina sp.]
MNLKRIVASFVTVFFCSTIIVNLSGIKVYAQTLNPFSTQVTVNGIGLDSGNTVNLVNGKTVSFDLNITVNQSAKPGDKLVFELPKGFDGAWVGTYPENAFSSCTVVGNTVTLVAGPDIARTLGAYLKIQSTLNVKKDSTGTDGPIIGSGKIPVTINGVTHEIKSNISEPAVSPDHGGSGDTGGGGNTGSGGTVGIQHITKLVNGYPSIKIGSVTSQNNILNYTVTLNTKEMKGPVTFTDNIPSNLKLQDSTVKVVAFIHGPQDITESLVKNNDLKIEGNKITLTGLKENAYYQIQYNAEIPLDYANSVSNTSITNTAYLNKDTSSATVKINTDKANITPSEVTHMISKQSNVNTFDQVGNTVSYRLNINPSFNYLKQSNFVDKMPNGLEVLPNINDLQISGITSTGLLSEYIVNEVVIGNNGNVIAKTNYPNAGGTVYIDAQKNEVYGSFSNLNDSMQISYVTKVTKLLGSITNNVKLDFGTHTSSSSATINFSSSAGSIQAWKTVNKSTLVDGENPNVDYTIHVVPYGGFPRGYLTITDPLEKGMILNKVTVPKGFTYKIEGTEATGYTVIATNTNVILAPGAESDVVINCSLANFKDGTTIHNQATINHLKTHIVTTKKGYSFTAQKVDKENPKKALANAIYGVYNANNELLYKVTSGIDGYMSGTIKAPGNYYLKELVAPVGFVLSNQKIPLIITQNDIGTNLNLGNIYDNQEVGTISITKTNEAGTAKLEGAEFTITKTGDKSFSKVITTNKEGVATVTNLAFGDYVVTETKAPQG